MSGGSPTLAALGKAAERAHAAGKALDAAKLGGQAAGSRYALWREQQYAIDALWAAIHDYAERPKRKLSDERSNLAGRGPEAAGDA